MVSPLQPVLTRGLSCAFALHQPHAAAKPAAQTAIIPSRPRIATKPMAGLRHLCGSSPILFEDYGEVAAKP
jgi:hypothetical protein